MKKIQVNLSLKQRLLLLLILVAVILSGIIIVRLIPYGSQCKTEIAPLGFVGTYHTDGSETSHPADNKLVSAFQSKGIVMQGYFNRPLLKGEHLFFLMEYMEVHISLNGTPLFSFGTEESRSPLVRSSGMSWGSLVIPEDVSSADEWTIELSSKYQNNYYSAYRDFMDSLQTGDSGALARSIMQKYWFYIIGGLVFFFKHTAFPVRACAVGTGDSHSPIRLPFLQLCHDQLLLDPAESGVQHPAIRKHSAYHAA